MMNKDDLIVALKDQFSLTEREATDYVNHIFKVMFEEIIREDREGHIKIRGFASMSARTRASREGMNPRTGEKIFIPPTHRLKFVPSQRMDRELKKQPEAL